MDFSSTSKVLLHSVLMRKQTYFSVTALLYSLTPVRKTEVFIVDINNNISVIHYFAKYCHTWMLPGSCPTYPTPDSPLLCVL